jgi:hypothetical protein
LFLMIVEQVMNYFDPFPKWSKIFLATVLIILKSDHKLAGICH